eukprot:6481751-Amphidinium_carterae.1
MFRELPDEVLEKDRWHTSFFGKFALAENIGVLEARSVLLALRNKSRILSNWHRHHLNLCDNMGVVLGLEKGRITSTSRASLLSICRKIATLLITTDCVLLKFIIAGWLRNRTPQMSLAEGMPLKNPKKRPAALRNASLRRLETASVHPKTLQIYQKALVEFRTFLSSRGKNLDQLALVSLDAMLVQFFDKLHSENRSRETAHRTYAGLLVLGTGALQVTKAQLPRCLRALRGWASLNPPSTRPPLPCLHAVLILDLALKNDLLHFTVALLVMWHTYMRPGELQRLPSSSVIPSLPPSAPHT